MKLVGKIKKYNGQYGIIDTEKGIVDFSSKDILFNQKNSRRFYC